MNIKNYFLFFISFVNIKYLITPSKEYLCEQAMWWILFILGAYYVLVISEGSPSSLKNMSVEEITRGKSLSLNSTQF